MSWNVLRYFNAYIQARLESPFIQLRRIITVAKTLSGTLSIMVYWCLDFFRCAGRPRQPSKLSGCNRWRYGSGYRVLGQLPQDLELNVKVLSIQHVQYSKNQPLPAQTKDTLFYTACKCILVPPTAIFGNTLVKIRGAMCNTPTFFVIFIWLTNLVPRTVAVDK